jgi:hypothetical protein
MHRSIFPLVVVAPAGHRGYAPSSPRRRASPRPEWHLGCCRRRALSPSSQSSPQPQGGSHDDRRSCHLGRGHVRQRLPLRADAPSLTHPRCRWGRGCGSGPGDRKSTLWVRWYPRELQLRPSFGAVIVCCVLRGFLLSPLFCLE